MPDLYPKGSPQGDLAPEIIRVIEADKILLGIFHEILNHKIANDKHGPNPDTKFEGVTKESPATRRQNDIDTLRFDCERSSQSNLYKVARSPLLIPLDHCDAYSLGPSIVRFPQSEKIQFRGRLTLWAYTFFLKEEEVRVSFKGKRGDTRIALVPSRVILRINPSRLSQDRLFTNEHAPKYDLVYPAQPKIDEDGVVYARYDATPQGALIAIGFGEGGPSDLFIKPDQYIDKNLYEMLIAGLKDHGCAPGGTTGPQGGNEPPSGGNTGGGGETGSKRSKTKGLRSGRQQIPLL